MKNFRAWLITVLLLVVAGVSLVSSSHKDLWRDEAFSILVAQQPIPEVITISARDFSPPLFYLLLHGWIKVFGTEVLAIRLLPLLFSLLSMGILLYLRPFFISLVTRYKPGKYTFLHVLYSGMVLLNIICLNFSFELRNYSSLFFLSLLSMLCLYNFLRTDQIKWGWGLLIANTAFLYDHNLGFIWVAGQAFTVGVWLLAQKRFRTLGKLLIISVITGILIVPWISVVYSQSQSFRQSFWLAFDPIGSLHEFNGLFVINEGVVRHAWAYILNLRVSFAVGTIGLLFGWRKYPQLRLPLVIFLAMIGLYYGLSTIGNPILYARYVSLLSPLAMLCVFLGFVGLYRLNILLCVFVLMPYVLSTGLMIENFTTGITKTAYSQLSKSKQSIYTQEAMDIMPCLYYVRNCYFVGDSTQTPSYIGVSHLGTVQSISDWSEIQERSIGVLYRDSLDSSITRNLETQRFIPGETTNLGDGVFLMKFTREI